MPKRNSIVVLRKAIAEAAEDRPVADIRWLLNLFDLVIEDLPLEQQLSFGGEAIASIAEIYQERSLLAMEEWENYQQNKVLSLAEGLLAGLVHTSTSLSLADLVESKLPNDYPILHQVNQVLSAPEQIEIGEEIESLSHDENLGEWIDIIRDYLSGLNQKQVNLVDIVNGTKLNLAKVFLGLLHGEFIIKQVEFYDLDSLVVLTNTNYKSK